MLCCVYYWLANLDKTEQILYFLLTVYIEWWASLKFISLHACALKINWFTSEISPIWKCYYYNSHIKFTYRGSFPKNLSIQRWCYLSLFLMWFNMYANHKPFPCTQYYHYFMDLSTWLYAWRSRTSLYVSILAIFSLVANCIVLLVQYMHAAITSAVVERVFTNWLFDAIIRAQLQKLIWLSYFSCCECVYLLPFDLWDQRKSSAYNNYGMLHWGKVTFLTGAHPPPNTSNHCLYSDMFLWSIY